jgi:hypothetical protein
MTSYPQALLFELEPLVVGRNSTSTTFLDNMKLPVHRWMRFSAGYSSAWAESVIREARAQAVLDPFVGSGTTLLAAQDAGVKGYGIEAHPFVVRIARAKLHRESDPAAFEKFAAAVRKEALGIDGQTEGYPPLIEKCYDLSVLRQLDALRRAVERANDGTPQAELTWLVLASLLRKVSHANTAQWQYVLPSKSKVKVVPPLKAFDDTVSMFAKDMRVFQRQERGPKPELIQGDARTCLHVPDGEIDLVVTSPPYPNNYDYADSTRLEMSFFKEIAGWGDLQDAVRQHLVRSCSQHVPEKKVALPPVLADPVLVPILDELAPVCQQLSDIRLTKGGRKTYHLMVACYFQDLAHVWHSLRRVCGSPSRVCFVIGDSAPSGVYVPVIQWFEKLALSAGFEKVTFEQTRERNIKWKNRKHRVPLCEGRLWVEG